MCCRQLVAWVGIVHDKALYMLACPCVNSILLMLCDHVWARQMLSSATELGRSVGGQVRGVMLNTIYVCQVVWKARVVDCMPSCSHAVSCAE